MDHLLVEVKNLDNVLKKYTELINCHLVGFFTEDLWSSLIPEYIQSHLLQLSKDQLLQFPSELDGIPESICRFLKPIQGMTCSKFAENDLLTNIKTLNPNYDVNRALDDLLGDEDGAEVIKDDDDYIVDKDVKKKSCNSFMSPKKNYEVERLGLFIVELSRRLEVSTILDAGSGKGYLGDFLASHGMNVVGFDAEGSNTEGALKRQKNVAKCRKNEKTRVENVNGMFSPHTAYINSSSDIDSLLEQSGIPESESLILTGLHACGDLTSNILRMFVASPRIKAVCVVGCCYNLITEIGECDDIKSGVTELQTTDTNSRKTFSGFPMSKALKSQQSTIGRNARMLACLSVDRIWQEKVFPSNTLFYRALTELLIESKGLQRNPEKRVKKVKADSFLDYVRVACKRLDVNIELGDEEIEEWFDNHKEDERKFIAVNQLRSAFSPVIESLIMLDRLLFLLEQETVAKATLLRIFDPIQSPRCWASIAFK